MHKHLLLAPLLLLASSLSAQDPVTIALVPWATGLDTVTDITNAGDARLFVVRKQGLIEIVTDSMTVAERPFLDIRGQVNSAGHEQGLLGLAFDPDYAESGRFYLNYITGTGTGTSVISRWTVSADPDSADAMSEEVLYTYPQPYANHNGGDLAFGPDGMLYIAFGDGGDAGDPQGHAQDLSNPLGDILRIDVSGVSGYVVPPSNPYVSALDTLHEIWASGLRNPFRISFDREEGDLWIGDVGQSSWEEVDYVESGDPGGLNFGWRCYEGLAPFNTEGCAAQSTYAQPVAVHLNDGMFTEWCAVIGGYVYRGTDWPHLTGRYIYTDYCKPQFWSLRAEGGGWVDEMVLEDTAHTAWTVIGEAADGELFVGNEAPGTVYKIIDRCPMDAPTLTYTDGVLTSSATDSTYLWYLNGLPIPGEDGPTYMPTENGAYHVVGVFMGGCRLSSDTLSIILTGIGERAVPSFSCVPDPADDQVVLSWSGPAQVDEVRVLDLQGRMVRSVAIPRSTRQVLATSDLFSGRYLVQLCSREGATLAVRQLTVLH